MPDIVATWPKKRALDSYLAELARADEQNLYINFRVPSLPSVTRWNRCYMVHDGLVRGWNDIREACWRDDVWDVTTGLPMKGGFFVVRMPKFFDISLCEGDPFAMKGFRGYRYTANVPDWPYSTGEA